MKLGGSHGRRTTSHGMEHLNQTPEPAIESESPSTPDGSHPWGGEPEGTAQRRRKLKWVRDAGRTSSGRETYEDALRCDWLLARRFEHATGGYLRDARCMPRPAPLVRLSGRARRQPPERRGGRQRFSARRGSPAVARHSRRAAPEVLSQHKQLGRSKGVDAPLRAPSSRGQTGDGSGAWTNRRRLPGVGVAGGSRSLSGAGGVRRAGRVSRV
jgi:hypothetical protein